MTLCAVLLLLLTGCGTTSVRVIPSDRAVTRMPAGRPFTPLVDSWAVPDARMLELLERGLVRTNELVR